MHHKKYKGTIFHAATLQVLPIVHQQVYKVDYSSRQIPRQPNSTEENIPHGTSNLTMEKNVVYGLLISFTHATLINYNDVVLPKIIHDKDLPKGCRASKKGHP
jgi:hypothetical protein